MSSHDDDRFGGGLGNGFNKAIAGVRGMAGYDFRTDLGARIEQFENAQKFAQGEMNAFDFIDSLNIRDIDNISFEYLGIDEEHLNTKMKGAIVALQRDSGAKKSSGLNFNGKQKKKGTFARKVAIEINGFNATNDTIQKLKHIKNLKIMNSSKEQKYLNAAQKFKDHLTS